MIRVAIAREDILRLIKSRLPMTKEVLNEPMIKDNLRAGKDYWEWKEYAFMHESDRELWYIYLLLKKDNEMYQKERYHLVYGSKKK